MCIPHACSCILLLVLAWLVLIYLLILPTYCLALLCTLVPFLSAISPVWFLLCVGLHYISHAASLWIGLYASLPGYACHGFYHTSVLPIPLPLFCISSAGFYWLRSYTTLCLACSIISSSLRNLPPRCPRLCWFATRLCIPYTPYLSPWFTPYHHHCLYTYITYLTYTFMLFALYAIPTTTFYASPYILLLHVLVSTYIYLFTTLFFFLYLPSFSPCPAPRLLLVGYSGYFGLLRMVLPTTPCAFSWFTTSRADYTVPLHVPAFITTYLYTMYYLFPTVYTTPPYMWLYLLTMDYIGLCYAYLCIHFIHGSSAIYICTMAGSPYMLYTYLCCYCFTLYLYCTAVLPCI